MLRPKFTLPLTLGLLFVFSVFVPFAQAQCSPASGTPGDDSIVCAGDDFDGISTGTGSDTVSLVSGNVFNTIISDGGALLILVQGGSLNTSVNFTDGVRMEGDGSVDIQGDLTAGFNGIVVLGTGDILILGDVTAQQAGVTLGSGTVDFTGTIIATFSDGILVSGAGEVFANGSITSAGDGIELGGGTVSFTGTIDSSQSNGIYVQGVGEVFAAGDITAAQQGISLGAGSVEFSGTINSEFSDGIYVAGVGQVTGAGSISAAGDGIEIGSGTVEFNGDITSGFSNGIYIVGDGQVQGAGSITASQHGIQLASGSVLYSGTVISYFADGIHIDGEGQVFVTGLVQGGGDGIELGSGFVSVDGDVTAQFGNGVLVNGAGIVAVSGNIQAPQAGIQLAGDGIVDFEGSIEAGIVGIEGGSGSQQVMVDGTINAPIAVRLGDGGDTLYVARESRIAGEIRMDGGDDTVQIGNGAVIVDTIYGGETGETLGDLLLIGDGQICSEDLEAVASARALADIDPNANVISFQGQVYTWAEFERIASGSYFNPCVGSINDGRVNRNDLGAPNALYCIVGGGVSVWEIDLNGQGSFSFAVTQQQFEAALAQAASSGANTLVASDNFGNSFHALSDGQTIAFIAPDLREPGKNYEFTFGRSFCAASA